MIKKILRPFAKRVIFNTQKFSNYIHNPILEQQLQTNLVSQWLLAKKQNIKLFDDIKSAGFRCYSQFEEDGILLYLLTMIGMKHRTVVELCCGSGEECMATNLIINHGFKGYLFDGNEADIRVAKDYFNSQADCLVFKPEVTHAWITKDNINNLLLRSGIQGEIDLLSLDMDGNDYYIWDAINVIQPRLCVFETHDIIPTDLSLTIPYADDFFAWDKKDPERDFRSVSLAAMNKLSQSKGYTLVGAHRHGFNVFYVRNDLLNDFLPRPSLADVHNNFWTKYGQEKRWPPVKDFRWVEV